MPTHLIISGGLHSAPTKVVFSDRQLTAWREQERELENVRRRPTAPKHPWVEKLGRHFLLAKRQPEPVNQPEPMKS